MRRLLCLLAVLLAGCAPFTDRVILLPAGDGGKTGALQVKGSHGDVLLADPYAQADVKAGRPILLASNAQSVAAVYGDLLAMQPMRPRRFIVYFELGGDTLTPESAPVLEQLIAALATTPGADLVVIGHTDRVGSVEANDRLSLQRATTVRDLLVTAGATADRISTAGRGEREPLVATDDEVPEPRNRRVEIKLR